MKYISAITEILSFFLVTIDLYGEERLTQLSILLKEKASLQKYNFDLKLKTLPFYPNLSPWQEKMLFVIFGVLCYSFIVIFIKSGETSFESFGQILGTLFISFVWVLITLGAFLYSRFYFFKAFYKIISFFISKVLIPIYSYSLKGTFILAGTLFFLISKIISVCC